MSFCRDKCLLVGFSLCILIPVAILVIFFYCFRSQFEETYLERVKRLSVWIGLAVVIVGVAIAVFVSSVHIIREGFVGIYFRNGALLDTVGSPGMHFSIPFITRVEEVDVRLATETIPDVEISTNDGVVASFVDVQVILMYLLTSQLIAIVPVP